MLLELLHCWNLGCALLKGQRQSHAGARANQPITDFLRHITRLIISIFFPIIFFLLDTLRAPGCLGFCWSIIH